MEVSDWGSGSRAGGIFITWFVDLYTVSFIPHGEKQDIEPQIASNGYVSTLHGGYTAISLSEYIWEWEAKEPAGTCNQESCCQTVG